MEALYGGIPDLVTATSGNGDRVPHNIVALLEAERRNLVMAQHDGGLVVGPAIRTCYPLDERNRPTATAAEVREWTALFKHEVEHAAELSIAAFDTHIAPQLVFLRYRLFYSTRCRPPKRYTAADLTAVFTGTDAAEYPGVRGGGLEAMERGRRGRGRQPGDEHSGPLDAAARDGTLQRALRRR